MINYSEIIGDIIINDILKMDSTYEKEKEQLLFDCAVINIAKKEDYLNISNKKSIVIYYFYSYKVKILARKLNDLYEKKIKDNKISYTEINKEIESIKRKLINELVKNLQTCSISSCFKGINMKENFQKRIEIAIDIMEGKIKAEEIKGNIFQIIKFLVLQMFNSINNFLHMFKGKI